MLQSKESDGIAIRLEIRRDHAGSPIQKVSCPTIYNVQFRILTLL
jgi:hypothetical protein